MQTQTLTADVAGVHFPGSILARFLELRGRRVVRGCGALWYAAPGRFLMSLPYQTMLNPDPLEVQWMVREHGVIGARFPSNHWGGLDSGLYILRRGPYELDAVHTKHRPRVRRGLERFRVRPATKAELLKQGRLLNLSTMSRQGRYDPEFGNRKRWEVFVEAAFTCREISCPAAFIGSRMAAYMVTCREQGWLHILHQMSNHEELADFPNHALTYTITKEALADESLDVVCYGYHPLFAADGLHEYKLRFGYEFVPHRSTIHLHSMIGSVFNCGLMRAAVRVARWIVPASQRLETIENLLKGARWSRPGAEQSS
jgi:hypothetical protein